MQLSSPQAEVRHWLHNPTWRSTTQCFFKLDSLTPQKYTTNTPSLRVRKWLLGVLSGNGDRKHANSTIVSWEISAEVGQATKGWRQKPKRPNQNVKIVGSLNMNMNVSSGATSTSQTQDELPWQTEFVWTLRHRHAPRNSLCRNSPRPDVKELCLDSLDMSR